MRVIGGVGICTEPTNAFVKTNASRRVAEVFEFGWDDVLHHIVRSQRFSEHFRSTSIISMTHSVQCVEVCLLVSLLSRRVPVRTSSHACP